MKSAMKIDRSGITRFVILTNRYALKLPRMNYGWAMFLRALLSNIQEARFNVLADQFQLCPTIFAVPGGWLNIQPRCAPLTDSEWADVELSGGEEAQYGQSNWHGFDCDLKRDNFGTLNGRVVLLDYGEVT